LKNKRQLAINLISNSIAFLVGPGINFVLYPYIIKHIGVEAFGFVGLAVNFVGYAQLVTIALNSMAGRFITIKIHENDMEAANRYLNSVFWANTVIGCILIVVAVFCVYFLEYMVKIPAGIMTDVKVLFAFTFLSFLINVTDATFGIGTFAKNRLDISAERDIAGSVLRAALLFVLYVFFSPKVAYMGAATFAMNVMVLAVNIFFLARLLPELKINRKYFDIKAMLEVASAGVWNVFGKLGSIFSQGLDLLIANIFISASAMGVISLSKTIPFIIISVLIMFTNVFAPQMTISYAQKDMDDLKSQLKFSMKAIGLFITLPVAAFLVLGDIFYSLWVPNQDAGLLSWLTFVNIGGLVLSGSMQGLSNVYVLVNKIKIPTLVNFFVNLANILIVFLLLNFVKDDTGRMFVIIGVNAAVGIIWNLTFSPLYAAKCLNFKWNEFYSEIAGNIYGFAIVTGLLFAIRYFYAPQTWLGLISVTAVACAAGLAANYYIMFSPEQRNRMSALLREKVLTKMGFKGKE